MDLKEIVGLHKSSVALVFNRMGITAAVSPKEVLLATLLYGDHFINALEAQIAADEGFTGFGDDENSPAWMANPVKRITSVSIPRPTANDEPTGSMAQVKTLPPVVVTAKKKSAKVKNTLQDILSVVATGIGAYSNAKAGTKAGTPTTNKPAATEEKKKTNWFLIGGVALIIVLAIAVFNNKKS